MRSETLDKGKDTQQTENAHEQFESVPRHLRSQCDLPSSTYGPSPTLGASSYAPDEFFWDPYSYMYSTYPYLEYWYPPPQPPPVQQPNNSRQRRSFIPSKSFRYLQMMYDNFHDYCDFFPDESGKWYDDRGWYDPGAYSNGAYDEWGVSVEVADVPRDYRPDVPPEEFCNGTGSHEADATGGSNTPPLPPRQEAPIAAQPEPAKSIPPSENESVEDTDASEHHEEEDCSVMETTTSEDCGVEGVVEEPASSASEPDSPLRAVRSVRDLGGCNDEMTIRTDDSCSTSSSSDGEDEGDESDTTESNNCDDTADECDKKYAVAEPREDNDESVECGDEWQFVRSQCCRHIDAVPRQLSVIYEESEHSAVSDTESGRNKKASLRQNCPVSAAFDEREEDTMDEGRSTEHDSDTTVENHSVLESDSSATLASGNHESDGSDVDEDSSTVTVRLPLRLRFSKSADESDVAMLIVGNSKIEVDKSDKSSEGVQVGEKTSSTFQNNASEMEAARVTSALEAAVSLATKHQETHQEEKTESFNVTVCDGTSSQNDNDDDDDDEEESEESDESSSDESDSENHGVSGPQQDNPAIANSSDVPQSANASGKIENVMNDLSNDVCKKTPDEAKKPKFQDLALEALLWHFKRYLQENLGSEDDSGVADMSRQLSDVETEDNEAEKRKCQRAKTHSRLFELLQEECKQPEELVQVINDVIQDDSPKVDETEASDHLTELRRRRMLLNLPVGPASETPASSSGVATPSLASPTSPTTRERLIAELIQELQRRTCTSTSTPPLRDVFQWMQDELVHTAQGETTANGYDNHQQYDGQYYMPPVQYRARCPKWAARCPLTNTAKCTNDEGKSNSKVAPSSQESSTFFPLKPPGDTSTANNTTNNTSSTS